PVFLVEDVVARLEVVDARESRQPEDLLVLHVLEDDELPQLGGDLDEVVALLGVASDLLDDVLEVFAGVEAEEVLLAELQALGAELQLLDALLDLAVKVLGLDAVD